MDKKNCENTEKTFKDLLYEKYGNRLDVANTSTGEDAVISMKNAIEDAAWNNRHNYARIFMNGLKIEAVIDYFTKEGFGVFYEQRYAKNSNNTGNQYTYVKISW